MITNLSIEHWLPSYNVKEKKIFAAAAFFCNVHVTKNRHNFIEEMTLLSIAIITLSNFFSPRNSIHLHLSWLNPILIQCTEEDYTFVAFQKSPKICQFKNRMDSRAAGEMRKFTTFSTKHVLHNFFSISGASLESSLAL